MLAQEAFFEAYRLFFTRLKRVALLGYNPFSWRLSTQVATRFAQRQRAVGVVAQQMQQGVQLPQHTAQREARHWLENFARAALTIFFYRRMNRRWMEQHLEVMEPELLREACAQGGMMLTYHTHFHNTLGCVMGIHGARVLGISAAKAPEHDHPLIRPFHMDVMHGESEKHFGGGRYLFLTDLRGVLRDIHHSAKERGLVIGLADFPAGDSKKQVHGVLFGHAVALQSWLLDLAAAKQEPVYLASLEASGAQGRLRLHLKRVAPGSTAALAQAYLDFLAERAHANPAFWQGWEWLPHLWLKGGATAVC